MATRPLKDAKSDTKESTDAIAEPKHKGQRPIKERVGGPLTHIVMFSGGMGSYLAAKRTVAAYGADRVKLLFADTTIEDEDLYRFLHQAAGLLRAEMVILKDGRDVWQVYKDARYIGNTRADPCSQVLKRQPLNKWVAERYHPEDCRIVVGIDWSEIHRYHRLQERNHPWIYTAPLCDAPYLDPPSMKKALKDDGLELPRLYKMGMPHNNCFGGEVRFLTDSGVRMLGDTVGQKVNVMGATGQWTPAVIRSFGKQALWRVGLAGYPGQYIRATADHGWFRRAGDVAEKVTTRDLRRGDLLQSFSDKQRDYSWVLSVEKTDAVEEVFCATVPDGHAFALDGGIITSNCGGFCCKAGQAQFAHLLKIMPERYKHHEAKEQELRAHLQKDVAILRDRTGGTTKPLTLKVLRERIEAKQAYDKTEWGGCGCFAGT